MTTKDFNEAVDDYGGRLYRMIYKSLKDVEESENLVQDTFEVLWQKKASVNYDQIKSFLFTTGYRKMIDLIRRNKRFNEIVGEMNIATFSDSSEQYHAKEILEMAFSQLEVKFKNVILLRDNEGYSYEEIGKITGMTSSQVRTNIFRGRKKMKELISEIEKYSTL
jgi:RNA polymerase sigma-70 factor (ECF subfamily)